MAQELVVLGTFNEVDILIRPADQMVDATAMCQAHGCNWSDYSRLASAKRFAEALSATLQKVQGQLATWTMDGPNGERHTFVHRRIALHCAAWISAEFEQWVYEKIEELLTKGHASVETKPRSNLQLARVMLEELEAHENRLGALEQQLSAIQGVQEQATLQLRDVERSEMPAPPLTARAKVRQLVNAYCQATAANQQDVWGKLYKGLFYRCSFNAQLKARNSGKTALQCTEEATSKSCTPSPRKRWCSDFADRITVISSDGNQIAVMGIPITEPSHQESLVAFSCAEPVQAHCGSAPAPLPQHCGEFCQ